MEGGQWSIWKSLLARFDDIVFAVAEENTGQVPKQRDKKWFFIERPVAHLVEHAPHVPRQSPYRSGLAACHPPFSLPLPSCLTSAVSI